MGIKTFDRANPANKQIEVYNDFSGGMNTDLADSAVKENQFRKLINFDMDMAGGLKKRPGLYRIPGAHYEGKWYQLNDYIKNYLQIAIDLKLIYNGTDESGNKIPTTLADLFIEDCIEFFDGVHWVFNFITNKCIVTIVLDKNMTIPEKYLNSDETHSPVIILPFGDGNLEYVNQYKTRISKFNDQFVMIQSYYASADSELHKGTRQVQVYSWCSIHKEQTQELYPHWIEASLDPTKVITETSYVGEQTVTIQSKTGNNWYNADDVFTITKINDSNKFFGQVKAGDNKYIGQNSRFYFEQDYDGEGYIFFNVWDTTNNKEIVLTPKHPNGSKINKNEVEYIICGKIGYTVQIYLRAPSKLSNSEDRYKAYKNSNIIEFNIRTGASVVAWNATYEHNLRTDRTYQYYGIGRINKDSFTAKQQYIDLKPVVNEEAYTYKNGLYNCMANRVIVTEMGSPNLIHTNTPYKSWSGSGYVFDTQDFASGLSWLYGFNQIDKTVETLTEYSNAWLKENALVDFTTSKHETINGYYKNPRYIGYGVLGLDGVIWKNVDNRGRATILYDTHLFTATNTNRQQYLNKSTSDKHKINTDRENFEVLTTTKSPVTSTGFQAEGEYPEVVLTTFTYTYPSPISSSEISTNELGPGPAAFGKSEVPANLFHWSGAKGNVVFRAAVNLLWTEKGYNNTFKNKVFPYEKRKFGFGNSMVTFDYNFKKQSFKDTKLYTSFLQSDNLSFYNPHNDFIPKLLKMNDLGIDTTVWYTGSQFFDKQGLTNLVNYLELALKGIVTKAQITISYKASLFGDTKYLDVTIPKYELPSLVDAFTNDEPSVYIDTIFKKDTPLYFKMGWKDANNEIHELFSLDKSHGDWSSNPNLFINSLRFTISYSYLPDGSVPQVLSFKQLSYTKPNLNDLTYLWYNLVLFDTKKDTTSPEIYNDTKHPNISNDLVLYPQIDNEGTPISAGVQIYGIYPVNDVILQPGKQSFQVFISGLDRKENDFDYDKYLAAITAMTIKDYQTMITSSEYSTGGPYKQDDIDKDKKNTKKSPNWKPWKEVFTKKDPYGTYCIFDLDVPSTTSPYMILVQLAEWDKDRKIKAEGESGKPDYKPEVTPDGFWPKIATVVESRIEMQPGSSVTNKIDVASLFDEFVSTNDLTQFASSVISFGNSNKLFFSDVSLASYFPLSRSLQLPTSEAVLACNEFQAKLIIATENNRYYLGGSSFEGDTDPFYLKTISVDSGLLAPKSSVPMGNYLYFLDKDGIKILKNLYGTTDKEFSYDYIDALIKSQIAFERDAIGCAFKGKYYLCFPSQQYMLVFNSQYSAWVAYESKHFMFSKMFVNDGKLYAVSNNKFEIYRFDDEVYVDNWNEVEDGYVTVVREQGGTIANVLEQGSSHIDHATPFECFLQTKALDQNYVPHQKKYDWALLNAHLSSINQPDTLNVDGQFPIEQKDILEGSKDFLVPYVLVDENLVNFKNDVKKDNNGYWYYEQIDPNNLILRDDSIVTSNATINESRLGKNNNSYYNIPIQRTGNTLTFGLAYKGRSGLRIDSFSVRFGLRGVRKNRRGIS